MPHRSSPDPEAPLAVRLAPALVLSALLTVTAAVLALAVNSTFWLLALAAVLVLAFALLVALSRAVRPALRPQRVKYDHSWWTNELGDTSTPHPGPAAAEPDPSATRPRADRDE